MVGTEEGLTLSNEDPSFHSTREERVLAGTGAFLLAAYLALLASLFLWGGVSLGGLVVVAVVVVGLGAPFVVLMDRRRLRQLENHPPYSVTIFGDRIAGDFRVRRRRGVRTVRLTIPFEVISGMRAGSDEPTKRGIGEPAVVVADYFRIWKPKSPTDLRIHAPVPEGCATQMLLAPRNFGPLRDAYLRRYPSLPMLPSASPPFVPAPFLPPL